MNSRLEMVSVEEARRLGAEIGIGEAQASRNAFRMLANHPDLARHVFGLLTMLSSRNKLDTRLRELIIMRLAWRTGSEYAWTQHYRIATQAGVMAEELVALRDWQSSDRFHPADRAVLAAADDTCERGAISDAVWAQCEQALHEPAVLIEMVVAIGNWTLFSQLLQSLRVPLEPGVMPWPPDGKAPPAAN
jgi:alkylhydroperoxidase family enzyme